MKMTIDAARMSTGALLAAIALAGTACGSQDSGPSHEDQASSVCQEAVADKMKDPSSSQFRNVTVVDGEDTTMNFLNEDGSRDEDVPGHYWKVSGQVNAKNGFGAMVGFSDFTCEANLYEGKEMSVGYVDVDGS